MKTTMDKGLKQAMMQGQPERLSSNFCYRTMQKVEEASRLRRQRADRRLFFLMVGASLLLAAGGVAVLSRYCHGTFVEGLSRAMEHGNGAMFLPLLVLVVLVMCLLFFDYWMRRTYFKRCADRGKKQQHLAGKGRQAE